MKITLYKVFDLSEINEYGTDPMDCCDVMTEDALRDEFLLAYNNGKIPHELVEDYKTNPDYNDENWEDIGNLKIGTMVDMLNDIQNYDLESGYNILETDVEIKIKD